MTMEKNVKRETQDVRRTVEQTELALGELEEVLDAGRPFDTASPAQDDREDAKSVGAHPVRDSGNGLPEGWGIESLEALTSKIGSGSTPKGGQKAYLEEGTPLIRSMNIHFDRIKKDGLAFISDEAAEKLKNVEVRTSDVLLNITGASIGRVNIATDEYSGARVNQHVAIIRMLNGMSAEYVCYYLRTPKVQSYIHSNESGATRQALTKDKIASFEIPLPPLAEQTVIAQTLDTLLAQVDNIKTRLDVIPKILKTFRQSVLAAAVSGKLTEDWRGENDISFDTWLFKKAVEVCEKVQSGSTPRDNPFDQGGNVPFLKVYNIVDQKISFDYKPQFVTKDTHEEKLKRSIAKPNDVLMNIVGPPLGKVAILTDQYPEWNINQAITLFRVNEENYLAKLLYLVLCEGELVRKVMPDTKGSVGQVNISLTQCREAIIPVPSIKEQTEIVRRVEELFAFADQIEQQVKNAQGRVNNLTQSILAKAFRGELTAQWRADNPDLISGENSAEALLAKIQQERDALKKSNKPKKATKKKTTAKKTARKKASA